MTSKHIFEMALSNYYYNLELLNSIKINININIFSITFISRINWRDDVKLISDK